MDTHLAAVATLALAMFFSPETLVLGLIIASDRRNPRLAAYAFAIGGVVGITFSTSIGLLIAHLSGDDGSARHSSWPGFLVRVVLAAVLLAIGLTRARNAIRREPISDISKPEQKSSRIATALKEHFPAVMRQFEPGVELAPRQSALRGLLGGFAMCGLHPKVFPVAIAAGHQISQITEVEQRSLAVVVFAAIAVVPALLPAVIETVRPGASGRIKEGYERIMAAHGRWITVALLLTASALIGYNAWEKYPGR